MKKYLSLVIICCACTDSDKPNMQLVKAYTDITVARYAIVDSAKLSQAYDSIAREHGFTPNEIRQELRAMGKNNKLMRAFYDSVTRRLDSLRSDANSDESH